MLGCRIRVWSMQPPLSRELLEQARERRDHPQRYTFVIGAGKVRKAARLGDDQAAETDDFWARYEADVPTGDLDKARLDIGPDVQRGDESLHTIGIAQHQLTEELLLVREVRVDRLLGDLSRRRDVVYARALVAPLEEQPGSRVPDRP